MVKRKKSYNELDVLLLVEIKRKVLQGISIEQISDELNITLAAISRIFEETLFAPHISDRNHKVKTHLGTKTEAYQTEKEALRGVPEYNWRTLSRIEKQFYYDYKRYSKYGEPLVRGI